VTATFAVPILIAFVGGALYLLPVNAKLAELGRIAFFVGLFWAVASATRTVVHF
jgi:Na+/phosphate symporter